MHLRRVQSLKAYYKYSIAALCHKDGFITCILLRTLLLLKHFLDNPNIQNKSTTVGLRVGFYLIVRTVWQRGQST